MSKFVIMMLLFSFILFGAKKEDSQKNEESKVYSSNSGYSSGNSSSTNSMFGLGISLNSNEYSLDGFPGNSNNVKIPINISGNLRIEPEVGFAFYDSDTDESSFFSIDVGIFYIIKKGNLNIYFGGRLGLIRQDIEHNEGNNQYEDDYTHFLLGGAIGCEYFFISSFSIGAEVQLNFISLDDNNDSSVFGNLNQFTVRWYF